MYGALDIPTSGLVAQRQRLTQISANTANRNTLLDENGDYAPYRRKFMVFAPGDGRGGQGVHVAKIEEDRSPLDLRYEPGSPYADANGYVAYPNVNSVIESMDAMEAFRAYQANITAAETTKSMMSVALQLIA